MHGEGDRATDPRATEWVLSDYFRSVDDLQSLIDDIEGDGLEDEAEEEELVRLVALRRDIAALRRRLYLNLQAYGVLAHSSFGTVAGTEAAADFGLLNDRLQLSALQQTWVFFVALAGMVIASTVLIVVVHWRRWL